MNSVSEFFNWLFTTRTGVLCLIGAGILLFLLISAVLEIKTRRIYKNHEKSEDDWSLFDSDDEDE